MTAARAPLRRGQPVVALTLVLASWIGGRVATWNVHAPEGPVGVAAQSGAVRTQAPQTLLAQVGPPGAAPVARRLPVPFAPSALSPAMAFSAPTASRVGAPVKITPAVPPQAAIGQQMPGVVGRQQLPTSPPTSTPRAAPPMEMRPARRGGEPRWSADAWLLLRRGGNGFNLPGAGLPGANLPTGAYGASQAGVVLRYRLVPGSAYRPTLYLRASTATQAPRGAEIAAGVSARPLAHVPLAAMAEVRATRTMTGKVVRPVVAAVTQLPPVDLPLGLRGEVYAQAGYVGGRGATGFVDGQARLDRRLKGTGRWELRAGPAAWGGAQKGTHRLDVGPSATIGIPLGPVTGRIAVDWRFRVAGSAAPGSGPAITLSAGF